MSFLVRIMRTRMFVGQGMVQKGLKMERQRAIELLSQSKAELQSRYGVTRLDLFGSTVRGTAGNGSDDDILWSIVQDDVPGLLPLLESLKKKPQE